jgi:hypothetical protein
VNVYWLHVWYSIPAMDVGIFHFQNDSDARQSGLQKVPCSFPRGGGGGGVCTPNKSLTIHLESGFLGSDAV